MRRCSCLQVFRASFNRSGNTARRVRHPKGYRGGCDVYSNAWGPERGIWSRFAVMIGIVGGDPWGEPRFRQSKCEHLERLLYRNVQRCWDALAILLAPHAIRLQQRRGGRMAMEKGGRAGNCCDG